MVDTAQAADSTAPLESGSVDAAVVDLTPKTTAQALELLRQSAEDFLAQLLSQAGVVQIGVLVLTGGIAWLVARAIRKRMPETARRPVDEEADDPDSWTLGALITLKTLIFPVLWVLSLWVFNGLFKQAGFGNDVLRISASLMQAWIVIRMFSSLVKDPLWSKAFAYVAWTIAALNIVRLLGPVIDILDGISLPLGDSRLSLYLIIKGALLLIALLWLASTVTHLIQLRVRRSKNLTASAQTLIAQAVRLLLLFSAFMVAMSAIGIDLTALAVFSGAVGVGIGFGLQAIFSNLVAGIIILIERSIKVGDFVELESGLTGEVREINIRSTRVTTNDNIDILVPNAEFINNRVTNWTLRDGHCRKRIPFGVAYGTDKEKVRDVVLEATRDISHLLTGRHAKPPQVWLIEFGDSSLNFELVVWLSPASVKRPSAVLADFNWAIETALSSNGIEIPFPQRDLHIRSSDLPLQIVTGA